MTHRLPPPDPIYRTLPDPDDAIYQFRCRDLVLEFRCVNPLGLWWPITRKTLRVNKRSPARDAVWLDLFLYPLHDSPDV